MTYGYDTEWALKRSLITALRESLDKAETAMDAVEEANKKTYAFYFNTTADSHIREAAKHLHAAAQSVRRDAPLPKRSESEMTWRDWAGIGLGIAGFYAVTWIVFAAF